MERGKMRTETELQTGTERVKWSTGATATTVGTGTV